MKRKIGVIIFLFIMIVNVGCSSATNNSQMLVPTEKTESGQATPLHTLEMVKNAIRLSEVTGWNSWDSVKIVNTVFYPKFQGGAVVQNDQYVFYPENGNKIMRIGKKDGQKICILELKKVQEEQTGAHICIAKDKLIIEYECEIYCCDFNGEAAERIISDGKAKMSSVVHKKLKKDSGNISDIWYHRGVLYLFERSGYILKLDIQSKKIAKVMNDIADSACFCDNALYYNDCYSENIYKVDLETGRRTNIKGKKQVKDKTDNTEVFYDGVMAVDGELYYFRSPKGKSPSLYHYREGKKDEKLYTFRGDVGRYTDLERAYLEYSDAYHEYRFLEVYDIRMRRVFSYALPKNFETAQFLADDILFYSSNNPKDNYLHPFVLSKEN